ncbi:hypothetical protein LguiA_002769 [Lonicera macranthoides]
MDNNATTIVSNTVNGGGNDFIVDTRAMDQDNKLVNEIDKMLDELEPPPSERCIYRVPRDLRKLKEAAYTPSIVSIGPFHHNNKTLESMDKVKKIYMKKLVRSSGNSSLRNCFDFVKRREKRLFSLATSASSQRYSILQLALEFLNEFCDLGFFEEFDKQNAKHNFQSVKHFTHLLLILLRPPPHEPSPPRKENFQSIPSSTNLIEAGVTFREKRPSKGLFDITFTKKVLEIPSFSLDDYTEIQIRNIMALELCHYPNNIFVSDFSVFMDCLVNTTRDVDLLVDKKIIINELGDNKEAAKFFNMLSANVPFDGDNFYFSQVCKELNDYYEAPSHKLKAMLKRDYFHPPWQTASTIAAIN